MSEREYIVDGVRMTEREMRRLAAREDASFGNDIAQTCRIAVNVLCLNGHDVQVILDTNLGEEPLSLSA